jgi:hypothetical protein
MMALILLSLKLARLGLCVFHICEDRNIFQSSFESLHITSDSQEAISSLEFEI